MAQTTIELTVEGMSCNHCVMAVKKALTGLEGIRQVEVDLQAKKVRVDYEDGTANLQGIRAAIEGQGYKVV